MSWYHVCSPRRPALEASGRYRGEQWAAFLEEETYVDFIEPESSHPFLSHKDAKFLTSLESACVYGPASAVQSMLASEAIAPIYLHQALTLAIDAGNVEIVDHLLANGACISRRTPDFILERPVHDQISMFESLMAHTNWTPNTRDIRGGVLLTRIVNNIPLLRWFLDHGADPNFGVLHDEPGRSGGPSTNSSQVLEYAAWRGPIEAVQMLLDAGAQAASGTPLNSAAGADLEELQRAGVLTQGFGRDRIPIMELLVSQGADVNKKLQTAYLTTTFPLTCAVRVEAPERVRWLLEHGANPHLQDYPMSAARWVRNEGSEEMQRVMEEGILAEKWLNGSADPAWRNHIVELSQPSFKIKAHGPRLNLEIVHRKTTGRLLQGHRSERIGAPDAGLL